MTAGQKQEAEGNSEKGGHYQPSGGVKVNLFPVLDDDDGCDGDGYENGERGGHFERDREGKQGDGDQAFTEAEG